jgi:ribosome biogenesis GTPase A
MPTIQWYPGHIAKAERQLKQQLSKVDVVLEVIDARIPISSQHPQVPGWIGEKPKMIILNRMDMVSQGVMQGWLEHFKGKGEQAYLTNARQGQGVKAIVRHAQKLSDQVNAKRKRKGMLPRPVRAVVIGFPNVGKSALINRLVGKKVVKSARKAGVTRHLQWVKISDAIELLDAPGIIPWKLEDQTSAVKLAICEDIGEASYENQFIAESLIDLLKELGHGEVLRDRYNLDPRDRTGEAYVYELGQTMGDPERAACQLLNDFRKGVMGPLALELPGS